MKRILSLVLVLSLVLGMFPAFAADATAGETLKSYGLLQGDSEGKLNEEGTITRAEMMTVLARLLKVENEAKAYELPSGFTDIADHWNKNVIGYAKQAGWTSGVTETTFEPQSKVTEQQAATFILRALGYDGADVWKTAIEEAKTLNIDTTVVASTEIKRGEVFSMALKALDTPVKDTEQKLGAKLEIADFTKPAEPTVAAVKIDTAVTLSTKVVEISLTDAATAVDKTVFTVTDKDAKAVAVASAELAKYDTDKKTVLIRLEADVAEGTLYTIKSGETTANFGGVKKETSKPSIDTITVADYNELTVKFTEAVENEGLVLTAAEKYGSKTALAVVSIEQTANDTFKVITADQKGSTLYTVTAEGVVDYAGNKMDKDTAQTFVGKAKATAKQTLSELKPASSVKIEAYFGQGLDKATAEVPTNYTVTEKYGAKATITVTEAKVVAKTSTKAEHVLLTLATDTKDATLYEVKVVNVKSKYDTALDSDQAKTFVGLAKDTTKLGTPTPSVSSNTEIVLDFGDSAKDDVDTTTTKDQFVISEKYGTKTALAITKIAIKDEKVTITTDKQKGATLYEVKIVKGIKDAAGNATTDDVTVSFVGTAVATKVADVTSATVNAAGTELTVVFDQSIDAKQAVDISHYTIDNSVGYPTKATYDSAKANTIVLTVPKTTEGKIYKLTVMNLNNADGIAMDTKGITETFVGKGNAATLPVIEAVMATDSQTIKIYFDRDVKGTDIKGKMWTGTAAANNLTVGAFLYSTTGVTPATDLAGLTEYAYQDSTEKNVLVVRVSAEAWKTVTTGSVFKLAGKAGLVKSTDALDFAPNTNAPDAPKMIAAAATDKSTVVVYFDTPVAEGSVGTTDFVISEAKDSNTNTMTFDAVYKVDAKTYKLHVVGTGMASKSYYLRTVEVSGNDADKTVDLITDSTGNLELAATTDSASAADYAYVEFGGNNSAPTAITDVYAVMTDKRTVVVYFPEAMDADSAKTLANYKIVKTADGNTVTTAQVAAMPASINDENTQVTLHLDNDIDSVDNVYVVVSSAVKTASKSNNVKADKTAMTGGVASGIVKEFAKGTATPVAAKIETVTLSDDRMGLTIKMNEKVAFDGATLTPVANAAIAVGNAVANDEFTDISTDTTAAFLKAHFDNVFTIKGQLVGDTAEGTLAIASVSRSSDGKSFVVTFAKALKPSTSGYVTTENADGTLFIYNMAYAQTKNTSADASKVTFGVPATANYDTTAPTVVGISATDGAYNLADVINVVVEFSENVVVTGTPQLVLDTATVDYTSGSGTNKLTFAYTVAAGHTATDLDNTVNGLGLNGGTIKDTSTTANVATLTIANDLMGAANAVVIDTTAPTATAAAGATLVLTYSEDLYIGGTAVANAADIKAQYTVTDGAGGAAAISITSAVYDSTAETVTFTLANLENLDVVTVASTLTDVAGNTVNTANDVATYTLGTTTWALN